MKLPFGSYRNESRPIAASRNVNVFAEASTERGPVALRRCPGIRPQLTVPGAVRGMSAMKGVPYAVAGRRLVKFSAKLELTDVGEIAGSGRVYMANNGVQMVITDDAGLGYLATETSISRMGDPDFRIAGSVDFIDNYIVAIELGTGRFFASDVGNASAWDALFFATAESAPDDLVGLIVDHEEVVLAGTDTMELWYNAGGIDFPFKRDSNGVVELGCLAGRSLVRQDNSVWWLASDRTIRRLSGVTPERKSQHGVEQAIQSYGDVSDCFGFPYVMEGHLCVCFQFPSVGRTWVFDITTGEWHERQSEDFSYWRASHAIRAYGKTWIGHPVEGKVGTLENDEPGDWNDTMRCEWTYPCVYGPAFHHQLVLGIEAGQGIPPGRDVKHYTTFKKVTGRTVTYPGVTDYAGVPRTPQVLLYVSDDAGEVFHSHGPRSLGRVGERQTSVRWTRLGPSVQRVYKNVVTDPVKFSVTNVELVADGARL